MSLLLPCRSSDGRIQAPTAQAAGCAPQSNSARTVKISDSRHVDDSVVDVAVNVQRGAVGLEINGGSAGRADALIKVNGHGARSKTVGSRRLDRGRGWNAGL